MLKNVFTFLPLWWGLLLNWKSFIFQLLDFVPKLFGVRIERLGLFSQQSCSCCWASRCRVLCRRWWLLIAVATQIDRFVGQIVIIYLSELFDSFLSDFNFVLSTKSSSLKFKLGLIKFILAIMINCRNLFEPKNKTKIGLEYYFYRQFLNHFTNIFHVITRTFNHFFGTYLNNVKTT